MDAVTLDFQPDADDHVAAARLYDRKSGWATADRVVAIVLLLVGTLATIAAGARWWTLVWFPLALLEWFHVLNVIPFATRFWFRRNPQFREAYHLEFDDTGIRFRTRAIESKLEWSMYQRVLEDPRVWALVYGPRLYTVLPKRAFTPDSERAFRALLARNLRGKAG
jgi:hypothetical protein